MNQVNKVKDQIDWSIVVSGVVTAIIIGLSIWGMRKAGLNTPAAVLKGGV
ncbi:MAG: hypothetical protein KA296_13720 [Marinobacter sp.]|nr:hypothetical protein [Marinobacter sp.]